MYVCILVIGAVRQNLAQKSMVCVQKWLVLFKRALYDGRSHWFPPDCIFAPQGCQLPPNLFCQKNDTSINPTVGAIVLRKNGYNQSFGPFEDRMNARLTLFV